MKANINNQQRKKSIFSLQNKNSDELREVYQQSDLMIDRSCQKQLFESRYLEMQNGFQGDSGISETNIHDDFRTISQQAFQLNSMQIDQNQGTIKKINTKNSGNSGNYDDEEADQVLFMEQIVNSGIHQIDSQNNNTKQKIDQSTELNMNLNKSELEQNSKSLNMDDSIISIQNNIKRLSPKKYNIQDTKQSNIESNFNIKSESKQTGWIPESLIYEKNKNQIKRMVTIAIKNQSQQNFQNTMQRKSMQNFEKATHIINRLLNSSMNRMMRIRQHVHNFVTLLKIRYNSKKSDNLCDQDYVAINDLCIFHKMNKKNQSVTFFILQINKIVKLTSKIPIFMPTDALRVVWDLFQVFFTYMFLYFYSIEMFFAQDQKDSEFIQKFFYYAFFLFILDILINFNTAFFDKDIIINKRKQIALQYIFSTLFITDCTSLIVLGAKVISQSTSIVFNPNHDILTYGLNMLIFLKANGMSPKRKRFDYVFTLKENQKHVLKLINQLVSVITVAHIAAIGWYFIGLQENINQYQISWLSKADLSMATYYQKYIYSIYWAITTMTTVGYGDIAATNYVEALFISINMILFSCVFAYSINNIGFILQEIEKSSKQLNDNITTIQRYLNRKNVNISLKSRVRHYLSFLAQEQKDRDKDAEDQILSILSNKLRDEITLEINTKILNQYHIFSSNFSKPTLTKMVFKMTEVLVSPNEVLFFDDQIDDQSIYFIQSGIIEIYQHSVMKENKVNVISTLSSNQLFGEIAFFSGLSRKASARSVNLSTLYKIKRDDFVDILQESDEDFERFKMIQEQIIFQEEINQLFVECYTCKQVGHIASQCPRTHQKFDKQFIVLKNNFTLFQERTKEIDRSLFRARFQRQQ